MFSRMQDILPLENNKFQQGLLVSTELAAGLFEGLGGSEETKSLNETEFHVFPHCFGGIRQCFQIQAGVFWVEKPVELSSTGT